VFGHVVGDGGSVRTLLDSPSNLDRRKIFVFVFNSNPTRPANSVREGVTWAGALYDRFLFESD
jgi:hypothetical protein